MTRCEELKKLRDNYKKQIAEINWRHSSAAFIPAHGQVYFFIKDCGEIVDTTYTADCGDRERVAIGNVYRSSKEAENKIKQLKEDRIALLNTPAQKLEAMNETHE